VLVQLGHLQFEISDRVVDARTPGVEFRSRRQEGILQGLDAGALLLVDVDEAVLQLGVEVADLPSGHGGEAVVQVVERDLRGWIHGAATALKPGEVVVGKIQNRVESDTRLLGYSDSLEKKKGNGTERSRVTAEDRIKR